MGSAYQSDAARSWEGSAVLGVSPMSDCRGFPHERLHQDKDCQLFNCSASTAHPTALK
ncbi:MAG: hypothetical protein F6K26_20675 [Moorea sp. SIO2I5]|nr:hypothetical protein [Moorena sp. SIO2I5]